MNYYDYLFFTLLVLLGQIGGNVGSSKVSVQWYCANEDCSEPISSAEPHVTYNPDMHGKVRLVPKTKVNVFKKPVDKNLVKLWLVEVNGKEKGYAPATHLKEIKTIAKKDRLVVVNDEIEREFIDSPDSYGPENYETKKEEDKPSESVNNPPQKDFNNENGENQQDSNADQNLSGGYSSQVNPVPFAENSKAGETLDQSEHTENPSNEATEGKVTPNPGITQTNDPELLVGENVTMVDEQTNPTDNSTVERTNSDEVNKTNTSFDQHGEQNLTVEVANSTLSEQMHDKSIQLNQSVNSETVSQIDPPTNVDKSTDVQSNEVAAAEKPDPMDQFESNKNHNNEATEGQINSHHVITQTSNSELSVGENITMVDGQPNPTDNSTVERTNSDEVNQTTTSFDRQGEQNLTVEVANDTLSEQMHDTSTNLNQNVNSETASQTNDPSINVDKSTDGPAGVKHDTTDQLESDKNPNNGATEGQVNPNHDSQTNMSEFSVGDNFTVVDEQSNQTDNSTVEETKLDDVIQTTTSFDQQGEQNSTIEVANVTLSEQMHDSSTALNQTVNSKVVKEHDPMIHSENPASSQTFEHPEQLDKEPAKVGTQSGPPDLQNREMHSIRAIPNEINESKNKEGYISDAGNGIQNQAQLGIVNDQNIGGTQFIENPSTISESNKIDKLHLSVEKPVEKEEQPYVTVKNNPYEVGTDDPKITAYNTATVKPDESQAEPKVEETYSQNVPGNSVNQPANTEQEQMENLDNKIDADGQQEDGQTYNWFSPIYSVINSCKEMFSSSDIKNDELLKVSDTLSPDKLVSEQHVESNIQSTSSSNEEAELPSDAHCDKEEELCNSGNIFAEENDRNDVNVNPGIYASSIGIDKLSADTILLLIITAVVVLLFSLGHYYIENSRRDGVLVAKINSLEGELFVIKKEQGMVDDQLSKSCDTISQLREQLRDQNEFVDKLQEELKENKTKQLTLGDTIIRQEKEIEMLMENGLEMHRLLSETISDEDRSQILLNNIAELKESLTERLNENISLTEQLDQKNQEIQLLKLDIKSSSDKQHDLEQKLINAHRDIEDRIFQATEPLKEQILKLEQNIAEKTSEHTHLESELAHLKCECDMWNARCMSAERGLRDAHGVCSSDAFNKWVDASEVHANLAAAEKQVNKLNQEKESILAAKSDLEAKLDDVHKEVSSLNEKYERVEKEKIEALTKLKVLSNYFNEKETQLQEELGLKEAQWLQKQSEGDTIYEQMRALREENLSYRSQNEMLKKEIIEQEASLKKQITSEEQKAHENWVALRQAERRLKEVQLEASQLRNRLTALESTANHSGDGQLSPNGLEPNGESPYPQAASPPFILYPREFMPPPPLTSATPTRPPPLGRISSPPIPVDFTPPPPLMPYEFFPPPSPPPPVPAVPPHLHKPQPRDAKREQKESFSSNYSSESATDKPARRGKR